MKKFVLITLGILITQILFADSEENTKPCVENCEEQSENEEIDRFKNTYSLA